MVISRGVAQKEATANRIVANRYLLSKKLGQGQYGTVYLVEDDQSLYTEEKFKVLKEIHVGEMPPDETIDAMREAKLQAKLDHIGVVKCFNNFLDKDFFCIISEYCNGGDLGLLIEKAKKEGTHFSEVEILDYFCQVVLATRYMHQKQILHRDLKPRNIFVKDNTCKLGDFGISRVLMGTADMASTFIGTPYYMSPECLRHEGYDSKSDMWSLGVILYELCTFEHCFDGESMMAVMYKITQGKIPKLPEHFSKGIQNIYE
ncbi:serine/threonine-protein kinase Nek11-like, partial [Convolutriloba macropyga]